MVLTYPDLFLDGRACVSSNVALRSCIFRRFLSTPSNLVIYKLIVLDYSVLQASVYRLGGVYVDDQLISHVVMTSCSLFCQRIKLLSRASAKRASSRRALSRRAPEPEAPNLNLRKVSEAGRPRASSSPRTVAEVQNKSQSSTRSKVFDVRRPHPKCWRRQPPSVSGKC